jgi:hypothetical protein
MLCHCFDGLADSFVLETMVSLAPLIFAAVQIETHQLVATNPEISPQQ